MTEEMKDLLTQQLESAHTAEEIDKALVGSMKALVDCQCKTAKRVKEMKAEADKRKHRIEGATFLWKILQLLAASGGGALILRLLANYGGQ